MKRVLCIAFFAVISFSNSTAQLSSINGELRYQNQYQDAVSGNSFYRLTRSNPQFVLGTAGYILSPFIFSFNVRSSLNLNYNNSSFAGLKNSYSQTIFGFYDLNVNALQRLPVRLSFSARDQEIKSTSSFSRFSLGFNDYRQQQQRVELSTMNVKFLPSTSFAYVRMRNWSDIPLNRFDQQQQELTLNMSQSMQDASVGLSGSLSENYEKYTGSRLRYLRFQMNGNKEFSSQHRVDITSEYFKFENTAMLSGNGLYNATLFKRFRLNTNILARNAYSQSTSSTTIAVGQSIQFLQNENFNYTVSVSDQIITDAYFDTANGFKQRTENLMGMGMIQHTGSISDVVISNGLSFGYSEQDSRLPQQSYITGITNSAQSTFNGYQLNVNQTLSVNRIKGYLRRDEINNLLNMMVSKTLPYEINSQTGFEFRNDRRINTTDMQYRFQSLQLRQNFRSSMYFYIPVSISVEGSINWIWAGVDGRTYGIMATLNSSSFFLQDLSMNYRLNRTYDIYYRRPFFEQTIELNYNWRALIFQVRFQEFRFVDLRHDIWFSVSRPFNIGL